MPNLALNKKIGYTVRKVLDSFLIVLSHRPCLLSVLINSITIADTLYAIIAYQSVTDMKRLVFETILQFIFICNDNIFLTNQFINCSTARASPLDIYSKLRVLSFPLNNSDGKLIIDTFFVLSEMSVALTGKIYQSNSFDALVFPNW